MYLNIFNVIGRHFFSLLFAFLSVISIISLATPSKSYALELRRDIINVSEDEIINDDLYILPSDNTDGIIEIAGTVNGDAIVFGSEISVSGDITGNLIVFGGSLDFTGNVDKSIFCASNKINLDGTIGRDIYTASYMLTSQADIKENAFIANETSNITGVIGEDLRIASMVANVDAEVGGDLLVSAQSGNIDQSKIEGTKIIDLGSDQTGEMLDSRFAFLREYSSNEFEETEKLESKITFGKVVNYILTFIFGFVGTFGLGYTLIKFFPVKTYGIVNNINSSTRRFWTSYLKGLLVEIVTISGFIFFTTISFFGLLINVPIAQLFAPLLNTAFLIGLLVMSICAVFFNIALGQSVLGLTSRVFKKPGIANKSYVISLIAGQLITGIIMLIPIVNAVYFGFMLPVVLGGIWQVKEDQLKSVNQ